MKLREFVQRLEEEISLVIKTHLPAIFPKQSAAPIAPPPPPPAAKPVSQLAKVEYDDDEAEGDEEEEEEVSEPVELKAAPIAPPPPAMPLPPPPPPMVMRPQVDIVAEFGKLSEEKQFEVAWLMLMKMPGYKVLRLISEYQNRREK